MRSKYQPPRHLVWSTVELDLADPFQRRWLLQQVLSPVQTAFLQIFTEFPDHEQFYLTGGTALAEFYLRHRLSYDLDFFK